MRSAAQTLSVPMPLEYGEDGVRFGSIPQFTPEFFVVEQPGNLGQHLDMISPALFRAQDDEKEVDVISVERFELNSRTRSEKSCDETIDTIGICMRNGHRITDTGTHDLFAFNHIFQNPIEIIDQTPGIQEFQNRSQHLLFAAWRQIEGDTLIAE
jgi:hypothetical protein